ncbi:MAG: hypothetical protein RL641_122 [Candidatus Parcubacteria bacterium]|jgi:hypothetical protein
MQRRINPENLTLYIYANDATSAKYIVTTLLAHGRDADTHNLELAWGQSLPSFKVDRHFASIFLSAPEIKNPIFYATEKGCPIGIIFGPETMKFLLSDTYEPDGFLYKDLLKIADRALYKREAERLLRGVMLMELRARDNNHRTFTVYELIEEYKQDTVKCQDLYGRDKVYYDYLKSKSFEFEVRKREGKFFLRIVSYPKVHVHAIPIETLAIPA